MTYTWTIALFAGLPERLGTPVITLELAREQMTAGELKHSLIQTYPDHADLISISFAACNEAYVPDGTVIRCDDVLALLPPVSGGQDEKEAALPSTPADDFYTITREPLDAAQVASRVQHPDHGAALVFIGTTREWTHGQRTIRLEYDTYEPMALRTMRQIGQELTQRWPGTMSAIAHRIGVVGIGEASVVIAVSSPHRDASYEASRYAIERLKQIVPIWKKEIGADGSQWKGHQQGHWNPLTAIPSPAATKEGGLKMSPSSSANRPMDVPDPSLRYARQIRFSPIGTSGQDRLSASSVAVVGMGALGCVIASHLVRSGVGEVRLIDRDIVEWSNLQRQLLYNEDDVRSGLPKAAAAADRLQSANSSVHILPLVADVNGGNIDRLLSGVELIVDGTDNLPSRYLLNDYSVKNDIPWIYGGAAGSSGMSMTIVPGETPCYRCLFPAPPAGGVTDTCETAGVLSPLVDIVGSLQALEAIKWLTGNRDALHRSLLQLDTWRNTYMPIAVANARRADCPCCGQRQFPFLAEEQGDSTVMLCGRSSIQVRPAREQLLDLQGLAARLSVTDRASLNPYSLRYLTEGGLTVILFRDGRALIQGTEDPIKAKAVYSQILG